MSYIILILQSLASLLKWLALKEEVKLKMIVIDLKEKYENEADDVQKQIDDLRAAGRDLAADRLRDQLIRRTQFSVDISGSIPLSEKGAGGADPKG